MTWDTPLAVTKLQGFFLLLLKWLIPVLLSSASWHGSHMKLMTVKQGFSTGWEQPRGLSVTSGDIFD